MDHWYIYNIIGPNTVYPVLEQTYLHLLLICNTAYVIVKELV